MNGSDPPVDSVLSHGTVEIRDIAATRRFYEEFLGLTVIQPLPIAIYAGSGGGWQLVCVRSGLKMKPQAIENRFCLHVGDAGMVREAHQAALRQQSNYDIKEIRPLEQADGVLCFILQDLNSVWWEISALPKRPLP